MFGDKPGSLSHSPGPGGRSVSGSQRLISVGVARAPKRHRSLRAPGTPPPPCPDPAHVTEQPAPPRSPATPKAGSAPEMKRHHPGVGQRWLSSPGVPGQHSGVLPADGMCRQPKAGRPAPHTAPVPQPPPKWEFDPSRKVAGRDHASPQQRSTFTAV